MKCLYCDKEAEKYCTLCYSCREKLPHAKALADLLKQIRESYAPPSKKREK